MLTSPALNELFTAYRDIQYTRYTHLCAGTIIFFDHVITLDQEIDLIWMEPWSRGKMLFLANRYYGFLVTIFDLYGILTPVLSDMFCRRLTEWQGWTGIIVSLIAQGILQLRIYALYPDNKLVLRSMVILFAISACVSCVIMAVFLSTFEATALAIPGGRFCVSSNPKVKYFHVLWIPMLAFETFLCTLAIIRGTQMRRSLGPFSFYKSSQRLAHVLFRDSIIYFIAIGATYLTSLLVWTFGAEALQETPLGFAIAFPCVIANRLVLNIRSTARAQDQAVHVDCNTTQGFNLSGSSGEAVTGPLVFSAKSYLSTGAAISTHPV